MQISGLLLALLPTIGLAAAQATATFVHCDPSETNADQLEFCARTALGIKPSAASYLASAFDHNTDFINAAKTITISGPNTLATNPVDQILGATAVIPQIPESLRAPLSSVIYEALALQTQTAAAAGTGAGAASAASGASGSAKASSSSGGAPALPRQTAMGVAAGVLAGFVGMAMGM